MDTSEIKEIIKTNRPKLSVKSINTYTSILKSIYKHHKDADDKLNTDFFNNQDNIIKKLKDIKPSIRKTLYSALIAITTDKHNDKYKAEMLKDAEYHKSDNLKQNKTEKQEKNWITQDEIKEKFGSMLKDTKTLWNKDNLDKNELKKLQDVIIVAITSGLFIPPRRSLDWTEFTTKNIDEKNDNFLKKNKIYFNVYKGSDKKGLQVIECPKPLLTLLRKWIKVNPHSYLIFDSNGNNMDSIKLNQHLERIWGKQAGINIFRHSYISEKYPIFNVEALKKDAENMGSSSNMMLETYIKKN